MIFLRRLYIDFDGVVLDTIPPLYKALEESKAELADLKTDYPLDVAKIIECQINIEAYEDGIERMQELGKELGFVNE